MKRFAAAALIGLLAKSASADTPPNVWDLAKNPNAYQQWRDHVRLSQHIELLDTYREIGGDTKADMTPAAVTRAVLALDEVKAPKDPWLKFDEAMIEMHRASLFEETALTLHRPPPRDTKEHWSRAIELLEPLAKTFEGAFFARDVWLKLAECYVHVERTTDEIRAYDEVITRVLGPESTMTPLLNQAEAYMRDGNVDQAIPQFREVYKLSGTSPIGNEIGVLAQWDLAVALDRGGDVQGGLAAARTAKNMDGRCLAFTTRHTLVRTTGCTGDDIAVIVVPAGLYPISEQNKDEVYFVPSYERAWYLALGRQALALDAASPKEAAEHWKRAETEMMDYVSQATLHGGDKWLDIARKRLDTIRKHRLEADKRAGITRLDL